MADPGRVPEPASSDRLTEELFDPLRWEIKNATGGVLGAAPISQEAVRLELHRLAQDEDNGFVALVRLMETVAYQLERIADFLEELSRK